MKDPSHRVLVWSLIAGASLLAACSRKAEPQPAPVSAASAKAVVTAPPPAPPAPPSAPPPAPPREVLGPPRQVVQGEGITLTEQSNGQVVLKTTTLWNGAIDSTYQDCDFYRAAIPVLTRQLSKERARLLPKLCVGGAHKAKAKTSAKATAQPARKPGAPAP